MAILSYTRKENTLGKPKDKIQELIRQKAYELYEKKGKTQGNELADWLQAEKIVTQQLKSKK